MSSVKITVVRQFDKHELFNPLPDELEKIPSPCRIKEGNEYVAVNSFLMASVAGLSTIYSGISST